MSELYAQEASFIPSGYGENRITLLTRDPHWLFAYWEISNNKLESFCKDFGQELWQKSTPVIKVTNVSKNEDFFIRINDFTDNWYIHVPDSNCMYIAELGRRVSDDLYINLASSNCVVTPVNYPSSDTTAYFIDYRDLKHGNPDLKSVQIVETKNFKIDEQAISGFSSPELYNLSIEDSGVGISSAEVFGINVAEHIGISSESLIDRQQVL